MYDLIIKNGTIIDGTGSEPYCADVAIKDEKIACIGANLTDSTQIIDATGLTVTPGFIDSHSHSDSAIINNPDQKEKIEQGITFSLSGQCGGSAAPSRRGDTITIFGEFMAKAEQIPQGSSLATFVGHGSLRRTVMGTELRDPTAEEMAKMKELLRDALENGAMGLSFGLIYTPSCYAKTEELKELARVAGEYKALVVAHIRNEADTLVEAVEEFLSVIKDSGCRGVFSHHKAAYKNNWGKVKTTLKMIDDANASGMDVYCDVYPYIASHTSLSTRFIPKELHAGGAAGLVKLLSDPAEREKLKVLYKAILGDKLDWILIASCKNHPEYEGLRLPEIAALRGCDNYDAAYDLIRDSGNVCQACYFSMCEEDVKTVLAHPRAMICTDSGVAGGKTVFHPRLKASFPRTLGRYVREEHVTSLPEMIRKMTSLPAHVYNLSGKGMIREGYDADICIFDAEKIIDKSDFTDCVQKNEGLNYVLVAGEVVVEDAEHNGKRLGKVYRAERCR